MKELNLPSWATLISKGKVEVNANEFYPLLLNELGVEPEQISQYWLEVAKCFMKYDVQIAMIGTEAAAEKGGALIISVRDDTKRETGDGQSAWKQSKYPEGKGIEQAAKDAKNLYKELRGVTPA